MEEAQRELGREFPRGWSAKSKTVPDYKKTMGGIATSLEKLDERLRGKLEKAHASDANWRNSGPWLSWEWKDPDMKRPWDAYVGSLEGALTAADIKHLKKKWAGLVISPVDKLQTDGLLI